MKVTASDASESVSDTFDIVVSLPPDTSPTLVSNAGQGDTLSSGVTIDRAQAFTTSAGGTLSSVEIISADSEGDDATVSLCTTNSSGQPTSSCRDLTAPSSFARGTLVFTAPADTALTANTTYSLVITSPGDDSLFLSYTMSDNEDTGGATGWSIANVHDSKNTANEWYIVGTALRITIKGTLTASSNNAPTVATAILDQTATTGTAFSYEVPPATFTDADSDTLTYTATLADDTALPSWLSFAPATRTFSGTPTAAGTRLGKGDGERRQRLGQRHLRHRGQRGADDHLHGDAGPQPPEADLDRRADGGGEHLRRRYRLLRIRRR